MSNTIAPEYRHRLLAGAYAAVGSAFRSTFQMERSKAGYPPEEDFVASFILKGLDMLDLQWRPALNNIGIKMNLVGVFCHQTPKAEYDNNGKKTAPELADLLLVYRCYEFGKLRRQVAVLIQAKMSELGDLKLSASDPQLILYQNWPRFRLITKRSPQRDFCLGIHDQQCVYATIATAIRPWFDWPHALYPIYSPWGIMRPKQAGCVEQSLADLIVKMLFFEAGRDFYDPQRTGCHWSELIDHLLTTTFMAPLRTRDFPRKPDSKGPIRGGSIDFDQTVFVSADPSIRNTAIPKNILAFSGKGSGPDRDISERPPEDGDGMSLVLIETDHGE